MEMSDGLLAFTPAMLSYYQGIALLDLGLEFRWLCARSVSGRN